MTSSSLILLAEGAAPAGGPGGLFGNPLVFPILMIVMMYFLLIRPQQRKAKEHQEMIKAVRRGDQIVMNGGLIGKVSKVVDDNELELEVAEGVKLRVLRGMIADVRTKGEPVKS